MSRRLSTSFFIWLGIYFRTLSWRHAPIIAPIPAPSPLSLWGSPGSGCHSRAGGQAGTHALNNTHTHSAQHGTQQRPKLPETSTVVLCQLWQPQHEATVRGWQAEVQQVQVNYSAQAFWLVSAKIREIIGILKSLRGFIIIFVTCSKTDLYFLIISKDALQAPT